jgi:alpha-glucosidase
MRRVFRAAAHVAEMARLFSDLGPRTAAAVLANTFDARVAKRRAPAGRGVPRDPGELIDAAPLHAERKDRAGRRRQVAVGLRCRFANAEVEVRFLADDLVRVDWGPGAPPPPWAVANDPVVDRPGPLGTVKVVSAPDGVAASTAALTVRVLPQGSVVFLSPAGALLRHELAPLRRGPGWAHRQLVRQGERLVGLGEQAGGLALSGRHRLWNRDPGAGWGPGTDPLYFVAPVVIGTHPAGNLLAFFENPAEGEVEVNGGAPSRMEVRFTSGMLRHYVAVGPVSTLLARYAALTGRPPLPPRWALGYHQSRWGYASADKVREVAQGFRDEGLPLSVVHLDIDYMDGYRVFTVDEGRFPDLGALAEALADQGTRIVTIVDPAVKAEPGYDVYDSGQPYFVRARDGEVFHGVVWPGRAAFPDFTDAGARLWWGGFYGRLLDRGVAGVWHDMNEPTSLALWGDQTLPLDARQAAGDHRRCHNAYGLLMAEAGAAALEAARPERRPFVLSRSGWAGLQRRSWIWTGDAETSWTSLRQQIPTILGLGLSGVPFSGPDIGGFTGSPTDELYVRWLELAVFLPLCRTHCTASAADREPWAFAAPSRGLIGDLIRFRYRLLPYLYTLADEAARTGAPLVRPPGWPSSVDTVASDEFLLGDALLVAPATTEGERSRRVVLPAGEWALWSPVPNGAAANDGRDAGDGGVGAVFHARTAHVEAPLGAPKVFVRAGTVLPLDDGPFRDGAIGLAHAPRLLSLHCVPDLSGRARGTLFDDAGDGYGPSRRHRFSLSSGAGGLRTFHWEREGDYPDPERIRVVLHGRAAAAVRADGVDVPYDVRRPRERRDGDVTGGAGPTVETVVDCAPFETVEFL